MIALLALAVVTAADMVVQSERSEAGQGCPSSAQVSAALSARLPAGPSVTTRAPLGVGFRLLLGQEGASAHLRLVDHNGHVVLARHLEAQTQPVDCAALADTVALIVERYFDEIEVRRLDAIAPAPPRPPAARPAWRGGITVLGRSGRGAVVSPGGGVFVERGQTYGRLHWTLTLSAGLMGSRVTAAEALSTKRDESWCLLGAGPWWGQGTNRFGLQAVLGMGLVRARRAGDEASVASAWGAEPWTGLNARYRAWWRNRWFAEASLGGYVAVVRHELVVTVLPEQMRRVVATTPRAFADLSLSVGLQF